MFDDLFEEDVEDYTDAQDTGDTKPAGMQPPRENLDLFQHDAHEKTLLTLYNNGTLPHALIFAGPSGVGKATMAFRLARFLLKHGAGGDDAQDSLFGDPLPKPVNMTVAADDPVFRKVASGGHPDLRYIERAFDEKRGVNKGVVDIESIREIAPFLRKTTAEGGWRIVIVDEADLMNRQAQNAILKILEEPPPKSLLILICNRLGAMIPTIRSRCRTFHFAPLPPAMLGDLLRRAAPGAADSDLDIIASLADGSLGRAIALHEEKGHLTLRTIIGFLEDWSSLDWERIHPMADNLSRADSEKGYQIFASVFEWTVQTLLKARATGTHILPQILKTEAILGLLAHYSLEQWIDICEKLGAHFITIENSNLDKRQGVIGAFAIVGGQI